MKENEQVILAQHDAAARERLIADSMDFICRCASKTAGRFVDRHDDACSEAMIAYNDAITAYEPQKGRFSAYAAASIHNRIIDYMRRETQSSRVVPFSSIAKEDDSGAELLPEFEDKTSKLSDAALEIYSLKQELQEYDISFFELSAASPKAQKTKAACIEVVHYIVGESALRKSVREKKCLPVQKLTQAFSVKPKILERYRKYIIAGVLICDGDYPTMKDFFDCGEEARHS